MQEPLFIQPVLQEKIWGGTSCATSTVTTFPVTIPGNAGRSAPILTAPEPWKTVHTPEPNWMSSMRSILSCSKIRLRPSSHC